MTRRKKFNRLVEAKQIAKQLLIHRMWYGLSQTKVANVFDITFQQYQKLERCENRGFAEQLLKICNEFNWCPRTILKADPVKMLDVWSQRRKAKTRPNINNTLDNIRNKLDKIDENAYKKYFRERN